MIILVFFDEGLDFVFLVSFFILSIDVLLEPFHCAVPYASINLLGVHKMVNILQTKVSIY